MGVRQFSPGILEHQARLVLELADRKGWNGFQRLFVASVLVLGTLRQALKVNRREFYYRNEGEAYRTELACKRARVRGFQVR